ncbi:type IV pilin protein [Acinetobacter puyangensis]|uniref:type IV pilin protein n=1 Tax=Acinetobacter puyangensis TaxID=1096779 RepID=UPI003A4E2963
MCIKFRDKQRTPIRSNPKNGFTLVELMVVVVIVAIFAAIAIPSYQAYIRKANLATAQQEMQRIAEQLSRHKARNFSYKGFDASYLYKDNSGNVNSNFNTAKQELKIPFDSSIAKYTLTIMGFSTDEKGDTDSSNDVVSEALLTSTSTANLGQSWSIKAVSSDPKNYNLLLTSNGIKCKNKTSFSSYINCGETGSEDW